MGKLEASIRILPDNPSKHIYWIVYNSDMIDMAVEAIKRVKGEAYLEHVTVVARSAPVKQRDNGYVYFDPYLLDLIGNGGT